MRIYLANAVRMTAAEALSEEVRKAYPWLLESYHYIAKKPDADDYLRANKMSIFLDSGAFTVFTKGGTIDLEEYARYYNARRDFIHVASNVDIIGRDAEEGSYENLRMLESYNANVCPVHHARDDDLWLRRYIREGYEYIFLGGMVAEQTGYLREWLDHVWDKYLTNKDGSAKVRVHGFGLTTPSLMARYPWFSVDSTSWVMYSSYGIILVDLPHRDVLVFISNESSSKHKLNKHFSVLPPAEREVIDARITALGYNSAEIADSYGLRCRWNVEFYKRMNERKDNNFIRRETSLF